MKFGAYDYLLKPFDIPQLLELVHRAVDSNRLMSEPVALGRIQPPRATRSSAKARPCRPFTRKLAASPPSR